MSVFYGGDTVGARFFDTFDKDGDGTITLNEILVATSEAITADPPIFTNDEFLLQTQQLLKLLKNKKEEGQADKAMDEMFAATKTTCCGEGTFCGTHCQAFTECWTSQVDNRIVLLAVADIRKVLDPLFKPSSNPSSNPHSHP